jgi:hypothetical protein
MLDIQKLADSMGALSFQKLIMQIGLALKQTPDS